MITAILCAAGKGERAGFRQNKVLNDLNGLPVLTYSLQAFAPVADEIVVTARPCDRAAIDALLAPYPHARISEGGETRAESVLKALKEAKGDIVLVHDAARPYVSEKIIADCIGSVKKYGSGVCALPVTDTVVCAKDGEILSVPPRDTLFTVQTPQGFYTEKLLAAYEAAMKEGTLARFSDDSGVYARYAQAPRLFLGDRGNRKLTFAEDFSAAERVGFGVDTHAFLTPEAKTQDAFIMLGGVKVPSHSRLIAHSDGDVLVHALMDALLTAAGLRDIGYYFPDSDEKYRGADSMKLLQEVMTLIQKQGFMPKNASISILAERPRLSPYIEAIRQSLATALCLPVHAVGVAAGTNERLGYVGEGKGITVYATVLCSRISFSK